MCKNRKSEREKKQYFFHDPGQAGWLALTLKLKIGYSFEGDSHILTQGSPRYREIQKMTVLCGFSLKRDFNLFGNRALLPN
jgi:hypothetical protein